MRTYRPGEQIVFRARRPCRMHGRLYRPGDRVAVILQRAWNSAEGIGSGGPWTDGGYTSRKVASLGQILTPVRRVRS